MSPFIGQHFSAKVCESLSAEFCDQLPPDAPAGAAPTSAGRGVRLAATAATLSLLISGISHRLLTLSRERDGVFARQADRPLYAFATDGLGLGGKGVTCEQCFTDGMHDFQHFVSAVGQRPAIAIFRARVAVTHKGAAQTIIQPCFQHPFFKNYGESCKCDVAAMGIAYGL